VFFWFVLLGGHLGSAAEAVGIAKPWRALLVLAVLAAVFVPLIRAAALETRQLCTHRTDRAVLLPSHPQIADLHSPHHAVLWVILGVALIGQDQPVFPLLPIAATIWLVFQVHRWRKRQSG
jgi:hypothetical protein